MPRPQTPDQSYCSEPQCQKALRKRWVDEKRKSDFIFRDNQSRAQKAWMERNPDYWRQYREENPDYAERNRARQRASFSSSKQLDGVYRIRSISAESLAKSNAWIVEITAVCSECPCKACGRYFRHRFTGIRPRMRSTEGYRLEVFEACDRLKTTSG